MSASSEPSASAVNAANPPPSVRRCDNCAAPLLGATCYACGQPTKGLIRRFGTIVGDFADTVFNIDSRVFRTLGPLLARPGYLTLQYLHGHRIRYVSPVRLFVFLSVLAFLATRWSVNIEPGNGSVRIGGGVDTTIGAAETPAEVIKQRDQALAGIAKARKEGAKVPGLTAGMDAAEMEVRKEADARLAELRAEAKLEGVGRGPVPGSDGPGTNGPGATRPGADRPMIDGGVDDAEISFGGDKPWDPVTNPVVLSWLPAAGNAKVNAWIGQARENAHEFKKNPNKLKDAFLGILPQTLFVLLPLFALLLKVVYLFKRRLYMEHLVVALHSHAFLCLAIGLQALLSIGEDLLPAGGLVTAVNVFEVVLWVWMPLYLLLTQKRVYGQGWIMTLLKFGVLGVAYFFLFTVAVTIALAISLVAA
jgi:hypothetical protein